MATAGLSPDAAGREPGGLTSAIGAILEADREEPRKQRHTAQRILGRLRDEHGFAGDHTS